MVHHRRRASIGLVLLSIFSFSLFACDISLAPQTKSPATSISLEHDVYARLKWQVTGMKVRSGDTLTVQYISGLWSPWPGGSYDGIGSGGDPNCDCNVIPGVSHAALIGKIGEGGDPFLVGNSFKQKMGVAGDLYLGINDTRVDDNSGSLKVKIILSP
jgi:hypothetical protein